MLCPLIILCHHIFYTLQYFHPNQISRFQNPSKSTWCPAASQIDCNCLSDFVIQSAAVSYNPWLLFQTTFSKQLVKRLCHYPHFSGCWDVFGAQSWTSFTDVQGVPSAPASLPALLQSTQLLKREVKAAEKPAHHRGREKGCQDHERHQPPCSLARCPFALVQEVAEPPVLKHQLEEQLFFPPTAEWLQNLLVLCCSSVICSMTQCRAPGNLKSLNVCNKPKV